MGSMKPITVPPTYVSPPATTTSTRGMVLALIVLGCAGMLAVARGCGQIGGSDARAAVSQLRLEQIPFDGQRAYGYLKDLCAIGPRPSGSPGMAAQQKMLVEHFRKMGAEVELQQFSTPHPVNHTPVAMANLIARWSPSLKQRIFFCAHYDTLPFPMMDPVNPKGVFVGANDGGSGVAILMELAHDLPRLSSKIGVDVVLFDAEEFIFDPSHPYFLGAEFFARQYVQQRPPYRYRWGVLLDMVGDADLQLYQERNSLFWKDTRPLVDDIWRIAQGLGVTEFVAKPKYEVMDDHLPLHNVGGIPVCDLIDFDYPPWHTRGDTPERCSALSLAKVGWVLREWLAAQQAVQTPRQSKD
jgi:glutaminyl-peptide cyclotransferase